MNNSLSGGQFCTDYVNIQQTGDNQIGHGRFIIPRLNFTCNGTITSIRARVNKLQPYEYNYPYFQVWRPSSVGSSTYNKVGEVQLQSVTSGSNGFLEANIILTVNNRIRFQSGDVVGFYHPLQSFYGVRTIQTNGYRLLRYHSNGSPSVTLSVAGTNNRQPLIQFTIGEYVQE